MILAAVIVAAVSLGTVLAAALTSAARDVPSPGSILHICPPADRMNKEGNPR